MMSNSEGSQSRTLPDYLLTQTKLPETLMPPYCQTNELAADIWRMNACFQLGSQQAQDLLLSTKENIPVNAVPISSQLLEVLTRLASKLDEIFLQINAYAHVNGSIGSELIHIALPKFMALHGNQLSRDEKITCLKVLHHCQSGDSVIENVWELLSDDFDLVALYLQGSVNSKSDEVWKLLEQLACFPFEHTQQPYTSMHEFLTSPPGDLINLGTYLGKGEFQDCQALRDDKRSLSDLVQHLLDTQQYPNINKLRVGVLWSRAVKDQATLQKALKISYLAMNQLIIKRKSQNYDLAKWTTPDQLFEVLQKTQDVDTALLVVHLLLARQTNEMTVQSDIKLYLDQVVEPLPLAQEEGEEPNFDQSYVYQVLKQICSVRQTALESEAQEDQESAFESKEPELEQTWEEGPIPQCLIRHPKVWHYFTKWANYVSPHMSKSAKAKFLQLQRSALIAESIKIDDKVVLQQSPIMILNLAHSVQTLKRTDPNAAKLQQWIEKLVGTWAQYLGQTIYWPPMHGFESPSEVTFSEKAEIIALFIQNFSKITQEGIPNDFGARLLEGKLLKILDKQILPLVENKGMSQSVDKVITAYVKLLTCMIENELDLISRLTTPVAEDESSELLIRVMTAMTRWTPNNKPTRLLSHNENLRVILKLLSALSVVEHGVKIALDKGPLMLQIVLSAKSPSVYCFQELRDREDPLSFKINGVIDTLHKRAPKVLNIIRDSILSRFQTAQQVAGELTSLFKNFMLEHSDNPNIAKMCLMDKHGDKVGQISSSINLLRMKIERQRGERGLSFEAFLSLFGNESQTMSYDGNRLDAGHLITQRPDIFDLMESLSFLGLKQHQKILVDLVTGMTESVDEQSVMQEQVFEPRVTKPLVDRFKSAVTRFNDATFVLTCSSFDQLTQNSAERRQEFINLRLYMLNSLMAMGRVGLFHDWSSEIKILMHLGRLRYRKTIDMTVQVMTDTKQTVLPEFDEDFKKSLRPKGQNLSGFEDLLLNFKKIQLKMTKFVDSHFGQTTQTWDSAFNYFLKLIYMTSSQRYQRQVPGQSVVEVATLNLQSLGENIASVSQLLITDFTQDEKLLDNVCHNAAILQQLTDFKSGLKILEMMNIAFIYKQGTEPLCKLYRALLKLEQTHFSAQTTEEDSEQEVDPKKAILKMLVYVQKIEVAQLLKVLIGAHKTKVLKEGQIAEYTKNQYETPSHFVMNQFAQIFDLLLDWESSKEESSLVLWPRTQLQGQDTLVSDLLSAMQDRPWTQMEDRNGKKREERKSSLEQASAQPQADREPTEQEIEAVTALGFDSYIAYHALRMARFNPEQAIEIMLTNQDGLLSFIEKEQLQKFKKEQDEMEKALKMSMSGQPGLEDEKSNKPLTAEEFDKKSDVYLAVLFGQLFQVTDKTVIDKRKALEILSKFDTAKIQDLKSELLTFVGGDNETSFEQQAYLLQIVLTFMQKSQTTFDLEQTKSLVAQVSKRQLSDKDGGKYPLYYLCLLLLKMSELDSSIQNAPEIQDFNFKVLKSSDAGAHTKDLVLMTVYTWLQSKPQEEASLSALKYVTELSSQEEQWETESEVMPQMHKLAMWSETSSQKVLDLQVLSDFVQLHQYKTELAKSLKLDETQDLAVQYKLKDIVQHAQFVTQNEHQIKTVIQQKCSVLRSSKVDDLLCKPNFDIQVEVKQLAQEVETIKKLKQSPALCHQIEEEALTGYTSTIQSNERQVFDLVYSQFESQSNDYFYLNQGSKVPEQTSLLMPHKFYKLRLLASMTQVHPHLVSLFARQSEDHPAFEQFASLFVDQLSTLAKAVNFSVTVSDILCALVGTNSQTPSQEFAVRRKVKHLILKKAVLKLSAIEEVTEEKVGLVLASLQLILALTEYENLYEFNRVLVSSSFYHDSIEYLVTETPFLDSVSKLQAQVALHFDANLEWQSQLMHQSIECIQAILYYLEVRKQEQKNPAKRGERVATEMLPLEMPPLIDQEGQPHLQIQIQAVEEGDLSHDEDDDNADDDDDDDDDDDQADPDDDVEDEEEDEEEQMPDDDEALLAQLEAEAEAQGVFNNQGEGDYSSEDEEHVEQQFQQQLIAQQDIINRPRLQDPNSRLGFNDIGFQARGPPPLGGMNNPFDHRGLFGGQHPQHLLHNPPLHGNAYYGGNRPGVQRHETSEFWTEQEKTAQKLLHSMLMDRTNLEVLPHSFHGRPSGHQTAKSHVNAFANQQQIELNRVSQKYDVLQPLPKLVLKKELRKNYNEFEKQQKKLISSVESTQFKDIAIDPRTYVSSGSEEDYRARQVQDAHDERLMEREQRFQMMIDAQRNRPFGQESSYEIETGFDLLAEPVQPQKPVDDQLNSLSKSLTTWLSENKLVEDLAPEIAEIVEEQMPPLSRVSSRSATSFDLGQVKELQPDNANIQISSEPVVLIQAEPLPQPESIQLEPSENVQVLVIEPVQEEEGSAFDDHVEEESEDQPQPLLEEPVSAIIEEGSAFEELEESKENQENQTDNVVVPQQEQPAAEQEPMTYGIPNSILLAHDIEPEILHDLPEDVRDELLSTVEWQPAAQQQNPAVAQPDANQQLAAQQSNIDLDFLNSLPADIRAEILEEERRNQEREAAQALAAQNGQPPPRQAEELDLASFIMTILDPAMREETLLGLDAPQLELLPPNIRAEAASAQQRYAERIAEQRNMQRMIDPRHQFLAAGGMQHNGGNDDDYANGLFGNRQNTLTSKFNQREQSNATVENLREFWVTPDEVFFALDTLVSKPIAEESSVADLADIESKLANEDLKFTDTLMAILLKFTMQSSEGKGSARFDLIGMMNSLSQLRSSSLHEKQQQNNRAKLPNAIMSQLVSNFDQLNRVQSLDVIDTSPTVDKEALVVQSLVLITCSRIFIKINRKYAQKLLQDFLQGQVDLQPICIISDQLHCLDKDQCLIVDDSYKSMLCKRALSRNLQLTLLDILKQTEKAFDKLVQDKSADLMNLQSKTIETLCGFFNLTSVKQTLAQELGLFLLKLSVVKDGNWTQIHKLCYKQLGQFQQRIIQTLSRINYAINTDQSLVDGNLEDDQAFNEDDLPDILMKKNSSHKAANTSPVVVELKVLGQDKLTLIDDLLSDSEKVLPSLGQMLQLYQVFEASDLKTEQMTADLVKMEEKHSGHKSQLKALNQTLSTLQSQKTLAPKLLITLSKHISCIFEMSQDELKQIVEVHAEVTKTQDVRMQPIRTEATYESDKQKMSTQVFKREVEISDQLFELCKFSLVNREFINKILAAIEASKEQSSLMTLINFMPNVLNFKRKQGFFRKEINKTSERRHAPQLSLVIKRNQIFMDSYSQLSHKSVAELQGPLRIDYAGERAIDAGGLTRDFYIELSRALFDPNYSLFTPTSNGVTFHPNQQSHVNPDHLNFFKFIGRVIGKALFDGELLELHFSKPLYKMMVGDDLIFEDLQDLDNEFHRSCLWSMKEDVTNLGLTFSVNRDYFGRVETKQLIENGSQIAVSQENKISYLEKLTCYQMYHAVKEQIDAFLHGFHELIPKKLAGIFTAAELELLISGLPKVDLIDMKNNTEFQLYTAESPQVQWLWKTLESFSQEEIGRFLQFVTGCSRVPLAGFAALQGMRGLQKFTITMMKDTTRLPQGHTCFNSIDLPEYQSFETLREKVLFAIMNTGGFGFA